MQIEIVPVAHGDCLLIGGNQDAPFPRMLVDGGPTGVWLDRVRPALRRHVAEDDLVVIDVVVVTHVDDDHIGGVLELFREMKRDLDAGTAARFRVDDLWHNAPGKARRASVPPPGAFDEPFEVEAASNSADRGGEADLKTTADATSFSQSDSLVTLAAELGIPINAAFGGAKIMEGLSPSSEAIKERVSVLGPDAEAFDRLDRAYRRGSGGDDGATAQAISDRSVPNLSSIVLLVEDEGRSLLLAADARGDRIARALGPATRKGERPAHVNVLKVPHHGSSRSVDEPFFRTVHADVYVFCGNGRHGNPERRTVERLLAARAGETIHLVFTSSAASVDEAVRADRERERERCRARGRDEPSAWTAEIDGLEYLLDRTPAEVTVTYIDVEPLTV